MKLLIVLPRTPWPPYAGQARLAFHRARELRKLGHDVSLFAYGKSLPIRTVHSELATAAAYDRFWLHSFGAIESFLTIAQSLFSLIISNIPLVSLIYTPPSVVARFKDLLAHSSFDIVHFYSINSYPLWAEVSVPYVVDLVDSMSLNLKARGSSVPFPLRFLFDKEYTSISRFESSLRVDSSCSAVLSVSKKDLSFFSLSYPSSLVSQPIFESHSIGVEVHKYISPQIVPGKTLNILFFGSLYYYPNIEAVLWFVDQVCPLLLHKLDFKFTIAGSTPDPILVDLSRKHNFVHLVSNPHNMNDLISHSNVTIAPMQSGSGQQFKVLESLACSTPVVASSLASTPLGLINGKHLLVADSPHSFAKSILSLASDNPLCADLTRSGWEYVSRTYSWKAKAQALETLYVHILSLAKS